MYRTDQEAKVRETERTCFRNVQQVQEFLQTGINRLLLWNTKVKNVHALFDAIKVNKDRHC